MKKKRGRSSKRRTAVFACGDDYIAIHGDVDGLLRLRVKQAEASRKRLIKDAVRVFGPKEGPRIVERAARIAAANLSVYVEVPAEKKRA